MVTAAGVQLCTEGFGDPDDPTMLLIAGAASSMDYWDVELCRRLAHGGRFVLRYDHRDTGRSASSPPGEPSYTAHDLATDPLRILDALGISHAHVVGISMGGGIAQQLAAHQPERIQTIALMATSPAGARSDDSPLPGMEPQVAAAFDKPAPEPAWDDRDAVIDYLVESERPFAGALGFDEERTHRLATIVVDRTSDIRAAVTNHWILDDGTPAPFRLADIHVPTMVLHGTTDPFFPFAHGEALVAEIPQASLIPLEGMGHQTPPPSLWDVVVPALLHHTRSTR